MAKLKLVAHYVVPTYNLVGNIAQTHVIRADYYGEKVDIDVWLANATLGDEKKSVLSSFANQRSLCEIQQGFAPFVVMRQAYFPRFFVAIDKKCFMICLFGESRRIKR